MLSRPLCCGIIPEDASENSTFRAGIGLEPFFRGKMVPPIPDPGPRISGREDTATRGVVEPKRELECPI